MDSINKESITEYFDLLDSALKENHLEDCLGQMYNMNKTGMPLHPSPPNIITKSGQKRLIAGSLGRKSK